MDKVIIGFEGEKTLRRISEILESSGITVLAACRSGAEIKRKISKLDSAIILCGYKLIDVTTECLFSDLPSGFSMLMLATKDQLGMCEEEAIFKICAPVKRNDLINSLSMLSQAHRSQTKHSVPQRTEEEKAIIREAKELLMSRNCMTEEQAHRFIQKKSMDTGSKMVQTAKMILEDIGIKA